MATRNRLLQAHRKWTALCLPEALVTGVQPASAAMESGGFVGLAAVAPLGEHLGGVDLTRPWQRREDLPVRVLPEPGGDGFVEVLDRGVDRFHHLDQSQDGVVECDGEVGVGDAGRRRSQPGEQLGGRSFPGVAAGGAERGDAFHTEVGCRGRGGVAAELIARGSCTSACLNVKCCLRSAMSTSP